MNRPDRINLTFFLLLLLPVFLLACSEQAPEQSGTELRTTSTPALAPAIEPPDLVIQGGVLLDMVADEPTPRPVKGLIIRDGKIERIIASDSAEALPQAAVTIDANSGYILPGYIDSHVHFRTFVPDASIWKRGSLYYGVTSLFDTGPCGDLCEQTGQDPNEWIVEYRDYMNSPDSSGPTLYITGKRIDGPADGGHPLAVQVNNANDIAEYIGYLVKLGVDGIKVESTLPADLRAMVMEEANRHNLPVVGHSKDARESIAAGMKFIEHMWPITSSLLSGPLPEETLTSPRHDELMDLSKADELIQLMIENEVYINPTMVGRYGYFSEAIASGAAEDEQNLQIGGVFYDLPEHMKQPVLDWWQRAESLSPEMLQSYKAGLVKVQAFLKQFSEAGGKVLAATDAGQDKLTGTILHREMQMLVDAGITPYRTLLGVTRWSSEMMYKDDLIGTLEEGKQADIVVLNSNPADNISNTKDIRFVVRRGEILRSPDDCSVIFPPVSFSCVDR